MELTKVNVLMSVGSIHVAMEIAKSRGLSALQLSEEEDVAVASMIDGQMALCRAELFKMGNDAITLKDKLKEASLEMNTDVIKKTSESFDAFEEMITKNLFDCNTTFGIDVEYTLAYVKARRVSIQAMIERINTTIDEMFEELAVKEAKVKKPRLYS